MASVALPGKSQGIKILTYNIRYNNPQDGPNHWPLRMNKVFHLLNKHQPDIMGLQEVLSDQLDDLLKHLPQYKSIGVGRDDGIDQGEFSPILYRPDKYELIRSNTFWLSENPDQPGSKNWDAALTRIATWAIFKDNVSGKQFFVINTHFDHRGKTARLKSAELIKKLTAQLSGNLPVVLMGDLNTEPAEDPYRTFIHAQPFTFMDSRPKENTQGTFCSFQLNMPCKIIDYIFYSPPFSVFHFEVITDNDGTYYPSDHLPVTAVFQLP